MIAQLLLFNTDGRTLTRIENVIKGAPTHKVHIERTYPEEGQRKIATFLLDSEQAALEFLIMISGGTVAGVWEESVTKAWNKNNLKEFYD